MREIFCFRNERFWGEMSMRIGAIRCSWFVTKSYAFCLSNFHWFEKCTRISRLQPRWLLDALVYASFPSFHRWNFGNSYEWFEIHESVECSKPADSFKSFFLSSYPHIFSHPSIFQNQQKLAQQTKIHNTINLNTRYEFLNPFPSRFLKYRNIRDEKMLIARETLDFTQDERNFLSVRGGENRYHDQGIVRYKAILEAQKCWTVLKKQVRCEQAW